MSWCCVQPPPRPLPRLIHWQDWAGDQQLLQRDIWQARVARICWSDAGEARSRWWVGRALGSHHLPLSSLPQVKLIKTYEFSCQWVNRNDLQAHCSCSHGNVFRRHLIYHSQVQKFKITLVKNSFFFTFLQVVAEFWDLHYYHYYHIIGLYSLCVFSFLWFYIIYETCFLILSKNFSFCRAGLSDTLQVQWKNKKSKIMLNLLSLLSS